jgi:large subunit ribosomal protein L15
MDLSTVHVGVHKLRKKRRPGRGIGSGMGKTATRGSKGQMSRAGAKTPIQIHEGGQMPLARRIGKRGFSNAYFRKQYAIVNLADLETRFANLAAIDEASLREAGLVKGRWDGVKILGDGELTKTFTLKVHRATESAVQKITAKGGKVELIPPPKKPVRNKMKPRPARVRAGEGG